MQVSAMRIAPDPACDDQDNCICTQHGASPDSLVISDETKDQDDSDDSDDDESEECISSTTIGYEYIPRGEPDIPWRHYLRFCEWDPAEVHKTLALAIRAMAHELGTYRIFWTTSEAKLTDYMTGHAIGLLHEHQRPDRDDFVTLLPHNLQGFRQLQAGVQEDPEKVFPESMSLRARLWKVIDDGRYAIRYFPIMIDFLKGDQFAGTPEAARSASSKSSVDFDYDSIMIYDSWMGGNGDPDTPNLWVTRRKDNGEGIWMGGSRDGVGASITEGDIARVAQLYDNGTPECRAAQRGRHNWGTGMRVRVRDGPWAHVDPPNKSNFAKMDEL